MATATVTLLLGLTLALLTTFGNIKYYISIGNNKNDNDQNDEGKEGGRMVALP
jgi:hypothetical protein